MSYGHTIVKDEKQVTVLAGMENLKLRRLAFNPGGHSVQINVEVQSFGPETFDAIAYLTPQEAMTLSKALREFAIAALEEIS